MFSKDEFREIRYRCQFDNTEFGVPYINDTFIIPINDQGANWDMIRQNHRVIEKEINEENEIENQNNQATLANEIKAQMLYYKVIRDKHDNSLINTMQDLNQMLNQSDIQKQARVNTECFVKLEHTQFSAQNKKAMTLLIILLERKNEILKNLVHVSWKRYEQLGRLRILRQNRMNGVVPDTRSCE